MVPLRPALEPFMKQHAMHHDENMQCPYGGVFLFEGALFKLFFFGRKAQGKPTKEPFRAAHDVLRQAPGMFF